MSARVYDWLFVDFNSYFASVEQQEQPDLRGRPVAVVPVETDSTCAIAASYEAKAHGVRTGTNIGEARRMCPGLVCVLARHDVYADYHRRILAELDRHAAFCQVESVDEMSCRLTGRLREHGRALAMARQIKAGLAERVGACMRCSIGISTNRYLAKVATELQKPDGLVVVHPDDLPGPLLRLELQDFPGIGANMYRRLLAAGIQTVEDLWACPSGQLHAIWGSVGGDRFWHMLRGVELPAEPVRRRSAGHSHVLAPADRPPHRAERVLRRLLLKAASRIRKMGYRTRSLTLSVRAERGEKWVLESRFDPVSDSFTLLERLASMWECVRAESGPAPIKKVSVTLGHLLPEDAAVQLQFLHEHGSPTVQERRQRLSAAMDSINLQFGRDSVTLGIMPGAGASFTGAKVAFQRVPDAEDFFA